MVLLLCNDGMFLEYGRWNWTFWLVWFSRVCVLCVCFTSNRTHLSFTPNTGKNPKPNQTLYAPRAAVHSVLSPTHLSGINVRFAQDLEFGPRPARGLLGANWWQLEGLKRRRNV